MLDTAGSIAELQLPSGHDPVVPRRPLRPVEPRRDAPWPSTSPACIVRPSGPTSGWPPSSATTARGTPTTSPTASKDAKLDTNVVAYVAAGIWHHWLITGDLAFIEAMWPTVERAIDWVLELQTPRGEVIWARHVDGTPWSYALLTGSSSIFHSLCCAVRLAELVGQERPDWELAAVNLAEVIRTQPDAFAPKHRWAMDWYYPVLGGVAHRAPRRSARLAAQLGHVRDGGPRRSLREQRTVGDGGRDGRVRAGPPRRGRRRDGPHPAVLDPPAPRRRRLVLDRPRLPRRN